MSSEVTRKKPRTFQTSALTWQSTGRRIGAALFALPASRGAGYFYIRLLDLWKIAMTTEQYPIVNEERQIDLATVHQTAVSLLSLDHQNFWQITAQYLVALAVLANLVAQPGSDLYVQSMASVLGFVICFLWNGNIERSNSWRDFRAKQIQNIERVMPRELKVVTEAEETR
jgi:hypothetical protein